MPLQVNPNRMELLQLKKKRQVAVRGHKLLKDKLEGLLKDFMQIINDYKELRRKVDEEISELFRNLILSSATMPKEAFLTALAFPTCTAKLDVEERMIMNVRVPTFRLEIEGTFLSYSLDTTTFDLDQAMGKLRHVLEQMVKLAELEKTIELVAAEIERTRRRVNALEFVMIPQLEETIKYIESKLDEMERGNITRLMKIKQLLGM